MTRSILSAPRAQAQYLACTNWKRPPREHPRENIKLQKGWGQNAKLGPHSAIWGKLSKALQAYALNPCTKFPPNPTSRKVNT